MAGDEEIRLQLQASNAALHIQIEKQQIAAVRLGGNVGFGAADHHLKPRIFAQAKPATRQLDDLGAQLHSRHLLGLQMLQYRVNQSTATQPHRQRARRIALPVPR